VRVSVIGLGKLGAPLAAALASKGNDVIGVDLNPAYVRLLSEGKAPVDEPRLQELIDASRARLRATTSFQDAVRDTELSCIIVPTPSGGDGAFSNRHVIAAVEAIGKALRGKPDYHVVSVISTVMPGSTDGEIRAALEASSGRKVGGNLGLCYNPEFVALGSVVQDLLRPEMILIGQSDTRAGDVLENLYRQLCDQNPPVARMNLVNAEVTKIALNTFVTTKITYANMLSEICERLPGGDVNVVTATLGLDSRIGRRYLQGAIGYGGPCFPRDNVAFAMLARRVGARADIAEATDRLNRHQTERLFAAATARLPAGATVGVLGLSYKPDTAVIDESQGVELVKRLAEAGYQVAAYDPQALPNALAALGAIFSATASAEDCVRAADRVVVTTAWPQFRAIPAGAFARAKAPIEVVDCWRILDSGQVGSSCTLVYLGQAREP
jgi:UDPglucose 6-dehydrogenase